jgi:glutathione synthase/RimK-type ligase-like ATP-grasp enzyme
MSSSWIVLKGRRCDITQNDTPNRIVGVAEYIATPLKLRGGGRPLIVNLASSYAYQSRGYYASLLAGARGHRVIPSVETIVNLSRRRLYENALPELEDVLNRYLPAEGELAARIRVFFGTVAEKHLARFGRLVFERFRAPALEIDLIPGKWVTIRRIRLLPYHRLDAEEKEHFLYAMEAHTRRLWREARPSAPAKYSIATLCDPNEVLPPSTIASLKHWAKIASKMAVDVSPISKRDLPKLANYDALFIRETTSISNHTYRFARRAQQEGMPVIDDPVSMIRCTNKVYLHELLAGANVPMPKTRIITRLGDLEAVADGIGFPVVLKIPDGSFSRGVKKAADMTELKALAEAWLKDTDLLIAQEFMPTEFDWRVGVLDGQPLFVTQYLMAKKHWQIINHEARGRNFEGGFRTRALADAPPELLGIATRAAARIGDGLYGVDIKETEKGYCVIEINDNPNLDHGVEDAADRDEVWQRLTRWFISRIDE